MATGISDLVKGFLESLTQSTRISFIFAGIAGILVLLPTSFFENVGLINFYVSYLPVIWLVLVIAFPAFLLGAIYDSRENLIAYFKKTIVDIYEKRRENEGEPFIYVEGEFRRWEGRIVREGREWTVRREPRLFCAKHDLELRLTGGLFGTYHSRCPICQEENIVYLGHAGINGDLPGVFYHNGTGYEATIDEIKRRVIQQKKRHEFQDVTVY